MKKFSTGFLFGVVTTASVVCGALFAFKKRVVEPIEDQEARFEENRQRANRKALSAHQS